MLVVGAASCSVKKRVVMAMPGAQHHNLLPSLMQTQVGGVNETTQDEVCEVGDEVIECHPVKERKGREGRMLQSKIWFIFKNSHLFFGDL